MQILKWTAVGAVAMTLTGCLGADVKPADEKKTEKDAKSTADKAATPPPAAPAYDPRDTMQAMSPLMGWPKDAGTLKEGLWVEQKMAGTGYKSAQKWAIVGIAGEAVKVEYSGDATQGYVQALTVNKADGKVTKAQAGKKGEKLKDIKVMELPAQPKGGEAPAATDDDVTVKAGAFKTKKVVSKTQLGETTSWSAAEGDAKGLLVKTDDGKGNGYELSAFAMEDVKVGGKSYKAKHATYSNGMEWVLVSDVSMPFISMGELGTMVKMVNPGPSTIENSWGEGAKAELDWGK